MNHSARSALPTLPALTASRLPIVQLCVVARLCLPVQNFLLWVLPMALCVPLQAMVDQGGF
jgi:hypothetical protein